jgi:FkbM family methyltransferase
VPIIGHRSASQILSAFFGWHHYIALWNMLRLYPDFAENLHRYLFDSGNYPYPIRVRTPAAGIVQPTLHSMHDLLTVNEVFCRHDYLADEKTRVVVDIGSNIGISALYFLTRNSTCRCYLYEPDPRNLARLRTNLAAYGSRYALHPVAVANHSGMVDFGTEPSGRYGGIGLRLTESIQVQCVDINVVLAQVLHREEQIDILKIDTEGAELDIVQAIRRDYLERIQRIYFESPSQRRLYPDLFEQQKYGGVCRLIRREIG